jgi:chorismate mutase
MLIHFNTEDETSAIKDVYLEGAKALRPDRG